MHEPVSYENSWLFLVGGIFLLVLLIFFVPKLIKLLDAWIDGRSRKTEKTDEPIKGREK